MISKKIITADGATNRFLSDFIIRSEQFVRVYAYKYDNTLAPDGTEDVLENPANPWAYPGNLYKRGRNIPNSAQDLLTIEKWELSDNSILTYLTPTASTKFYLEVATTAEEFGDTLTAPSVEKAEAAALAAEVSAAAALVSETNAAASAVSASTSATNAAASETAAASSASSAGASATSASTSATNAAASATASANSATSSTTSATASANSAAAAAISETNAAASASSASTSATASANSAAAALVSETNAAASAASINPANLLHVVGTGAGNPEGYTSTETDTALALKSDITYVDNEITSRAQIGKNHLINGAFQVNQYANIDTAPVAIVNGTYQIDRHMSIITGVTGTIQRLAKSLINGKYVHTVKCIATSTASGTLGLTQKLEMFYNGETKTFGVMVKSNNVNARALLNDGVTYTTDVHTGDGTYQFLSFPKTIDASATQLWAYAIISDASGAAVSISTNDYIESTMWQLEDGTVATPFEQEDIAETELKCKRFLPYRNEIGVTYLAHGLGQGITTTTATILLSTKVSARLIPTAVTYSGNLQLVPSDNASAIAVTSLAVSTGLTSKNQIVLTATVASGIVLGQIYVLRSANDTSAYIQVQTEL